MRICFISEALQCGGKERQFVELIKGLITRKLIAAENIMAITMRSEGFYDNVVERMGVKIETIERSYKKDFFLTFRLFKIIKKFNPDLIHSISVMTTTYVGLIKLLCKFKLIDGSIRSAPNKRFIPFKIRFLNYLNFCLSSLMISNSKAGLITFGSPLKKSFVIYNGIDLERMSNLVSKDIMMKKFNIDKKDRIVGMVANFNRYKDYGTFVKAAEVLLQKRKNLIFLAVGRGPFLEKIKKSVDPIYKNKIRFLGIQSPIEPIINLFDLAVLTTHGEGISNAILEYMALGKPVITTECAGTKEIIQNGITGLFVKPNSVHDLTDKIEYLLQNEELMFKMGQSAASHIKTKFGIDKMINSYYQAYKNLQN